MFLYIIVEEGKSVCSNTIKRTVKSKNLKLFEDGKLIVECNSDFEAEQFICIIREFYDPCFDGTKAIGGYYSMKGGWLLYESSIPTFPSFIKPNILNFKEFIKQEKEEMEKTNFEVYFNELEKLIAKNLKKDIAVTQTLCEFYKKVNNAKGCTLEEILAWLFSDYKPVEYKTGQYIVIGSKIYIIDQINRSEDLSAQVIKCKNGPTLYNTNSSIDHELSHKLNS